VGGGGGERYGRLGTNEEIKPLFLLDCRRVRHHVLPLLKMIVAAGMRLEMVSLRVLGWR